MIKVFHGPDEFVLSTFFLDNDTLRSRVLSQFQYYRLVAEVDTEALETAYRLTNTVEAPWWEHSPVHFHGSSAHGLKGARSTSTGDVFERADGRRYIVASFGFVPLGSDEADSLSSPET